MDTTLLNSNYLNKNDNIDLLALLNKFEGSFKFHHNHNLMKEKLAPKSIGEIQLYYKQQVELRETENWDEVFQKSLQETSGSFAFTKVTTKISKGQVLEVKEIIEVTLLLNAYLNVQKAIRLTGLDLLDPNLYRKNFKLFFSEAEVLFDFTSRSLVTYKHPKLKSLDKKIQETSKEIRANLAKVSTKWANDGILQQNEYDLFDDKFVLPVRSDRYNGQLGRIIYRSNTGNTLYIEPFSLRVLSNKLEELKAQLEREIFKLLKNLCEELEKNLSYLRHVFNYIITVDNAQGRLKCALRYNLNQPNISNEGKSFEVKGVFNPLIEDPITNDIRLTKGEGGLLISGPNTGGKTVLLKSLCLCFVLPHLGFFIPAKEADLPLLRSIYFLSHDNQSLIDGLSSFSSEAINYLEVIKKLDSSSVIFIDEIFNSTSSLEASELAVALIRQLKHVQALVFLSSHHEALKESIYQEGLLQSGHMGFTEKSSEPTYVFHSGVPGKSFAREVFLDIESRTLGHPIVSRWLGEVTKDKEVINQTIQDLDQIREEGIKFKKEYEKLSQELSREKENVRSLLEIERKKLESNYDKRWAKLKKETLDLTESVKKGKLTNIKKVSEQLNQYHANNADALESKDSKPNNGFPQESFKVGDSVFLKGLNKSGVVAKVQKNKVQVVAGKLKTWVDTQELLGSTEKPQASEKVLINVHKENSHRGMLLDARGMRRDEFLNKSEAYILDVINGDLPFVDIIHGHGDGILKKSLYDLLKNYSEVSAGHIEGNMGTTRIELVN